MVICTVGTVCCLQFGPTIAEKKHAKPAEMLNPKVLSYLTIGFLLLIGLTIVEHKASLRTFLPQFAQHFVLPFLTALAFCLEKIFNTEIGFVRDMKDLWE